MTTAIGTVSTLSSYTAPSAGITPYGVKISGSVTAFATGTQAGALQIPQGQFFTNVGVVAASLDSMALPRLPILNQPYTVVNNGVNTCAIFPSNTSGDNSIINNYAANVSFKLGCNASVIFTAVSNTTPAAVGGVVQWFASGYSGMPPVINLTATPATLNGSHANASVVLNIATGTFTLPAIASSVGMKLSFILGTTSVGTLQIINAAAATPIVGAAFGGPNAGVVSRTGAGTLSVRFSTTCVLGDRIDLFCDGVQWYAQGWSSGNTAATSILFA